MHCNPFQFFTHLPYFLMLIVKIEIIPCLPERNLDSVPIWFPITLRIYRSVEPEQQPYKGKNSSKRWIPEFNS